MRDWSLGMLVVCPILWLLSFPLLRLGDRQRQQENQREALYYAPGLDAYQRGDYRTAVDDLHQFLGLAGEGQNYYAWYALGLCRVRQGQTYKAQQEFQRVVDETGRMHIPDQGRELGAEAQRMLSWVQQNPNATSPPAVLEDMTSLRRCWRT